jgi:hypothetical protein
MFLASITLLIIGIASPENDVLLWVGLVLSGLIVPGYIWLYIISAITKYKELFDKLTGFKGGEYPSHLWILPIPTNS